MADQATIANIDAFIAAHSDADFSLRSGSLDPDHPEQVRFFFGEMAQSSNDFTSPEGGWPTLEAALDDIGTQIGQLGGA